MRVFQIACVSKISSSMASRLYFDFTAQNIITATLWGLLMEVATHPGAGGFIPGPGWFIPKASLAAHDVVVYFVADPSKSVSKAANAPSPTGSNLGGWTVQSANGVVCEVYVDGNLPAVRLAKIAFHEIMHNKLDVGSRVLSNLHTGGGGGLAKPPTNEWTALTTANKTFLANNLFKPVRQYTAAMPV